MAIALLIAALWASGGVLTSIIAARVRLSGEIDDLRSQFASLQARRHDIRTLERRLAEMKTSPALRHAVLLTDSDRTGVADLQRSVRANIQSGHGSLLSLSEIKGVGKQHLGFLLRARIPEPAIQTLMAAFENGDPHLTVSALSLVAKSTGPGREPDIELTATINALWLHPDGTAP